MSVETLQRDLAARLFAGDASPAWLLLDTMHNDMPDILAEDVAPEDVHVVPLARDDIPQERYPRLVRLHEHDVERLRASVVMALDEQADPDVERQAGFAIGGWLVASAPAQIVARHLAADMTQRQAGVGRKYFRWADRRVLEWMWPAMDVESRRGLLGPVSTWLTLGRAGAPIDYSVSTQPDKVTAWRADAKAWQRATDCEPVQMLLRGWQRFEPQLPPDYLLRAGHAVRAARVVGLVELAEIVLMATYVLQVHPRLCEHPSLRQAVHVAKTLPRPLIEVLADIPDPDGWNRMRDELNHGAVVTA